MRCATSARACTLNVCRLLASPCNEHTQHTTRVKLPQLQLNPVLNVRWAGPLPELWLEHGSNQRQLVSGAASGSSGAGRTATKVHAPYVPSKPLIIMAFDSRFQTDERSFVASGSISVEQVRVLGCLCWLDTCAAGTSSRGSQCFSRCSIPTYRPCPVHVSVKHTHTHIYCCCERIQVLQRGGTVALALVDTAGANRGHVQLSLQVVPVPDTGRPPSPLLGRCVSPFADPELQRCVDRAALFWVLQLCGGPLLPLQLLSESKPHLHRLATLKVQTPTSC